MKHMDTIKTGHRIFQNYPLTKRLGGGMTRAFFLCFWAGRNGTLKEDGSRWTYTEIIQSFREEMGMDYEELGEEAAKFWINTYLKEKIGR